MTISIASGKGGTGKTTVAVGLAEVLDRAIRRAGSTGNDDSAGGSTEHARPSGVRILDCDVEEPNDHLFLGAEETSREEFSVMVPRIDTQKCTACNECVEFCDYHALALFGNKVMVFDNLCHGCGGCTILCPEHAITEEARPIGELVGGRVAGIEALYGILNVGEVLAPPIIREVKRRGGASYGAAGAGSPAVSPAGDGHNDPDNELSEHIIIDSPPGTTCPMVTAVKDSDFAVLVTENTPFGLHDLELAVETISEMDIPMGVVINRSDVGHADVEEYCRKMNIPVLMKIPYDEDVAAGYAKGRSIVQSVPAYEKKFLDLYRLIERRFAERQARPDREHVGEERPGKENRS